MFSGQAAGVPVIEPTSTSSVRPIFFCVILWVTWLRQIKVNSFKNNLNFI